MTKILNIFTDGGARGNPGPAAIGVYIENEKGEKITEFGKKIGIATNNTAEYEAVINTLLWVIEHKEELSGVESLNFHLDSELVCSQINGLFRIKNANLGSYLFQLRELESKLNLDIYYRHIPRERNKKADKLVNSALDSRD